MNRELTAKNVNWAIVSDTPPDGREELLLSATHTLVWHYLMENFESVECQCLPRSMKIFRRKHLGR